MVGVIFAIDHLDDDVLGISHHQVVFSLILNLKVQSNLAVREFYVSNIKWSSLVKVNVLNKGIKHCVPDYVKITHLKRITLAYGCRNLCLNEQFILKGVMSQGYCCLRSLLC